MKKSPSPDKQADSLVSLRRKAEEKLRTPLERLQKISARDIKELVHELGTHQIELEMQNEELRTARDELESKRNQYVELYDFAPVGYFTIDAQGLIEGVNLTGAHLLGIERGLLLKRPFIGFIAEAADRELFAKHRKEVFQKQGNQACKIRLKRKNGAVFHAQLQSMARENIDGKAGSIRTTIVDITEHKKAEEIIEQTGALQSAIFNSANFSSIATDAKGVIRNFSVGAGRMLSYMAAEVMNKLFLCTALNATESFRSTREDKK